jgi:hypothetical protein
MALSSALHRSVYNPFHRLLSKHFTFCTPGFVIAATCPHLLRWAVYAFRNAAHG